MVDGVAARLLERNAAPSREEAAAVHRTSPRRRLVDVAVRHQLIRFVADISRFYVNLSDLPVQREVPLLTISRREVERPPVDVDEKVVEISAREANRREPARRTQSSSRIKLITRIGKAGR